MTAADDEHDSLGPDAHNLGSSAAFLSSIVLNGGDKADRLIGVTGDLTEPLLGVDNKTRKALKGNPFLQGN